MSAAPRRRLFRLRPPPLLLLLLLLLLPLLPPPGAWALLGGPDELCPRKLDCTLQRRELCPRGFHACGPCLPQFVEDGQGKCIAKEPTAQGRAALPSLEEEIDFVSDVVSRKSEAQLLHSQEGGPAPTGQHSRSGASKAESSRSKQGRWPSPTEPAHGSPVKSGPLSSNDAVILGLIIVCTAAGIAALVVAAVCWCRLQKEIRLARKADYGAHRLPGPPSHDSLSPGDRKLAQSAQMYHYQHQKQQMLSMEKQKEETKGPESASSDEENDEGDFTVYECPGLAPTGEMEVKNPLFDDSSLPPKPHP